MIPPTAILQSFVGTFRTQQVVSKITASMTALTSQTTST
jgi:hypothetical protein